MNKTTYFKNIWSKGILCIGYSELKTFDKVVAIIFARINTEYNYAVGHNYIIGDYCFAYNEQEIADSVNLTVEDVKTAIKKLEDLQLIETAQINSFSLMHVNIDEVCRYIEKVEKQNNYSMWDNGLNTLQGNAFSEIEFNSESKKLVEKFKSNKYELAVDENGNPLEF